MTASRWKTAIAGACIAVAAVAAYHNSFLGPFIFDDVCSIAENPTVRRLSAVGSLLSPPADVTTGGRPLANVTIGINYAISGTEVWSYHAFNLLVHILAGLTLFGVVRRTPWPGSEKPAGAQEGVWDSRTLLALAISIIWVLHPLQTESVTYIVQRTESLMGLFYLLTLYCFIRGASDHHEMHDRHESLHGAEQGCAPTAPGAGTSNRWLVLSVVSCFLGMACKEVMVTAPVIVLLYDRTFLAGSFAAAWRRRWRWHACLAAAWLLLLFLVVSTGGNRGGTTGMGSGAGFFDYLLTQFPAVAGYLWLSVCPNSQVFDHGAEWVKNGADVVLPAVVVISLLAGTIAALRRWPAAGFLGAWFFAVLAPSSLVPGARQTMAEHRMYLALAPVIVFLVFGLFRWMGWRSLAVWLAVALVFAGLTIRRNEVYRSVFSIWNDTVAKQPDNPWAQCNLGMGLIDLGKPAEAMVHIEKSLKLKPVDSGALNDLGLALVATGRTAEAVGCYEKALSIRPDFAEAHNNLGNALADLGRGAGALMHFETALRLKPDLAIAYFDFGSALAQLGRMDEAIERFRRAVALNPNHAASFTNLGNALLQSGRVGEAIPQYENSLRLKPDNPTARYNLAMALAEVGRYSDAAGHLREVLRLRPDDSEARAALEKLQAMLQERAGSL